jgi:hypothetical protein
MNFISGNKTGSSYYTGDKNKLYNVMGLARYGVKLWDGTILLEAVVKWGAGFEPLIIEDKWYPVLFDVEKEGRYPSPEEWAGWIKDFIR